MSDCVGGLATIGNTNFLSVVSNQYNKLYGFKNLLSFIPFEMFLGCRLLDVYSTTLLSAFCIFLKPIIESEDSPS